MAEAEKEEQFLCWRAADLVRRDVEETSWTAFWRVAVEGERPADVASDLGMSINAVYLARVRILARLREEFAGLIAFEGAGSPPPLSPPGTTVLPDREASNETG